MTNKIAVCAVFDIGKTNKKLLLFDKNYQIIADNQAKFEEIADDDGFACDDLQRLTNWIKDSFNELLGSEIYEVKALNFATYGASFVHLDANNQAVTPLYNYLKSFPKELKKAFFEKYGSIENFATTTASPDLGMLNSGLQNYWLKYSKPDVFAKIKNSLHLPQYCSSLLTHENVAEPTSIGCHTALWNFPTSTYHHWVTDEKLENLQQEILPSNHVFQRGFGGKNIAIGIGIHDSSAALVPYLRTFKEPFILLSTGTWCISMNPFNDNALTINELQQDCLCYLTYEGKPVKASRLFAGNEHERQTKHLSAYFKKDPDYYKNIVLDKEIIWHLRTRFKQAMPTTAEVGALIDSPFMERNLNLFRSYEEAYHQFMLDLIAQQVASMKLAIGTTTIRKIFVDGGFSKNSIFMELLAEAFYDKEVYASEISQATSLGAAMVIADAWTDQKFEDFRVMKY